MAWQLSTQFIRPAPRRRFYTAERSDLIDTAGTSGSIAIAAPAHLAITTPAGVQPEQALPAVTVSEEDANNSVITTGTTSVTIAIASGTAGATHSAARSPSRWSTAWQLSVI